MRLELEGVGRLVERDPGPERRRAARPASGPSPGCSPRRTAACRAPPRSDSRARSYWPRTRVPMKPSRNPSWRVVTQRLASAIVALARPPPGGTTWSSRSVSSLPSATRTSRCWRGPSPPGRRRPTARRRPAAGSRGRSTGPARCGPWPPRRRARRRAARRRRACPARRRSRRDGDPLDLGPVDQTAPRGLLGPPAGDRGGRPERGPDQEPGLPDAVVAPRAAVRRCGRSSASPAHRAATAELDLLDVGEVDAEQPAGEGAERGRVAGRQLADGSRRAGRIGASRPLIAEQLGERRGRRRRGVDDRHALADLRRDDRRAAAGSGCSRAAACRWSRRAAAGRSTRRPRRARRAAAPARRRRRPRRSARSASPASTSGTSVGVACS